MPNCKYSRSCLNIVRRLWSSRFAKCCRSCASTRWSAVHLAWQQPFWPRSASFINSSARSIVFGNTSPNKIRIGCMLRPLPQATLFGFLLVRLCGFVHHHDLARQRRRGICTKLDGWVANTGQWIHQRRRCVHDVVAERHLCWTALSLVA